MSSTTRSSTAARRRIIASIALLIAALVVPGSVSAKPSGDVNVQLLAFNDFHGNSTRRPARAATINGTPAGGVEYLATAIKQLRAEAEAGVATPRPSPPVTWSARRPLVSAAFHDEPTIEEMNALGLDVTARRQPRVRRGRRRAAAHAERRLPPGRRLPGRRRLRRRRLPVPRRQRGQQEHRQADPAAPTRSEGRRRQGRLHRHDARGHRRASSTRTASRASTSSTRSRRPTGYAASCRPRACTRSSCCCTRAAASGTARRRPDRLRRLHRRDRRHRRPASTRRRRGRQRPHPPLLQLRAAQLVPARTRS